MTCHSGAQRRNKGMFYKEAGSRSAKKAPRQSKLPGNMTRHMPSGLKMCTAAGLPARKPLTWLWCQSGGLDWYQMDNF